MTLHRLLLLLTLALCGLTAPGCPGDDDDSAPTDDDDATGDDDDATSDDDDATSDDDDSAPGDDDDSTAGDDDDATADDDDSGPPGDDDDIGPPGDDDDSGPPGDDDDSTPPSYFINTAILNTSLVHETGVSPCPQSASEVTLFNNTGASTSFTATVALSGGNDQVFGFATADVEANGVGQATLTGTVPGPGSLNIYAGLLLCSGVTNTDSNFTITMGTGSSVATSTGTLTVTFQ